MIILLIGKGVVDFLLVLIKLQRFRSNGDELTKNFMYKGSPAHQPFFFSEN